MIDIQLVVLCGGLGTRLGSISKKTPKILIPILDKTFLEHFLDVHQENGFKKRLVFIRQSKTLCKR